MSIFFQKMFYFCEHVCYTSYKKLVLTYPIGIYRNGSEKMLTALELGNYLQSIRKAQHLSLRKVNELSGISYSYLNMIEHGTRKVTPELLQKLARLYQMDYLELYQKAGYLEEKPHKNGIPYYAGMQDYMQHSTPMEILPLEDFSLFKSYFAISMMDDSMLPSIWKEDIIILEENTDFVSGDILLLYISPQNYLIRKVKKTENGIMLQAFSEQYEPAFYTNEDFSSQKVKVLGIVRQLRRKF